MRTYYKSSLLNSFVHLDHDWNDRNGDEVLVPLRTQFCHLL